MTTDQIVNNYTLWSNNCPRAEHFISISPGVRAQESRNFQILPTKVEHLKTYTLLPE